MAPLKKSDFDKLLVKAKGEGLLWDNDLSFKVWSFHFVVQVGNKTEDGRIDIKADPLYARVFSSLVDQVLNGKELLADFATQRVSLKRSTTHWREEPKTNVYLFDEIRPRSK